MAPAILVRSAVGVRPGGGQLPAGQRAGPGTVGYLGDESDLTLITNGASLTGTSLEGNASWDGDVLRITANNFTVTGFKIMAGMYTTTTGTLTVENCVIDRNGTSAFYGVYQASVTGPVVVRDTTIRDSAPNGNGAQCINADSGHVSVYRCDLSGFEDCVGAGGDMIISQVYGHGLDGTGTDPHNDVIQHFPSGSNGGIVEHSYLICSEHGNESVPATGQSACLTFKTDDNMTCNNTFMQWGAFCFRLENAATGVVFTNNDFGPLTGGTFGEVTTDGASVTTTWTNNRDSNGDIVPDPA